MRNKETKILLIIITLIQAKINDEVGMPPGKQKLQYQDIFLKVTFTFIIIFCSRGTRILLENRVGLILRNTNSYEINNVQHAWFPFFLFISISFSLHLSSFQCLALYMFMQKV